MNTTNFIICECSSNRIGLDVCVATVIFFIYFLFWKVHFNPRNVSSQQLTSERLRDNDT